MCGIAGFYSGRRNYTGEESRWRTVLDEMNRAQKRRGPDEEGTCLYAHCGLAHVRLSIIDLDRGRQPMTRAAGGKRCTVSFNGEIYNMPELRRELEREGAVFESHSDTEVILQGYLLHGKEYVEKLNGIFAIALWDSCEDSLYLFRDRVGVKPLFYMIQEDTLIFASELKGIFAYPGVRPVLDRDGLCEIFALGPAKTYGKGVFRGVYEVLPGHYLRCRDGVFRDVCYWKPQSAPHEDSFEEIRWGKGQILKEGKDILHLGFSSGLSGTLNSMKIAGEMLEEKYPEAKVIVIDTLCACLGEALLLYKALQQKEKGMNIDELAKWVEENKLHVCHNVTVDDLNHLHRGGRVSKTTAV